MHRERNVVINPYPLNLSDQFVVERWTQPGFSIHALMGYCLSEHLTLRIEPTFTIARSELLWVAADYSRNPEGIQSSAPGLAWLERRVTARVQPVKFLNVSYSF
jgi:hypothetical protein